VTTEHNISQKLKKLSSSKFRSSFKLGKQDFEYIERIGMPKLKSHAKDFITQKLSQAYPENDGKQTPFRGHPVFKAQHATATCCRGCLYKWHKIPKGRRLNESETGYVMNIIMSWIQKEKKV